MKRVHLDLGTGDGTYAYRLAKSNPHLFVIGLDSNAENLREVSHKAGLKPPKGGLSNLVFIHQSLEECPGELEKIADTLSVILPWGSLLRAVAAPDAHSLGTLRALCKPKAKITLLFGYGPEADGSMMKDLELPLLKPEFIQKRLKQEYFEQGFKVSAKTISLDEVRQIQSTWAKKLAYSGKNRTFVKIEGILENS